MCCRVEEHSYLPVASSAMPGPAHSLLSSLSTNTGAFSTNFKGRGGLHGDSSTQGCQMHRLEHMAEEQRQAFDVSSAAPTSLHPPLWPLRPSQQNGSYPPGGAELPQLTYAHTKASHC